MNVSLKCEMIMKLTPGRLLRFQHPTVNFKNFFPFVLDAHALIGQTFFYLYVMFSPAPILFPKPTPEPRPSSLLISFNQSYQFNLIF
jgi:hypothetical protein